MTNKPDLEELLECLTENWPLKYKPGLAPAVSAFYADVWHSLFACSESGTDVRRPIITERIYEPVKFTYKEYREAAEKYRQKKQLKKRAGFNPPVKRYK